MSAPLRLLISARDPGAAQHLLPLAQLALQRPEFDITLAASQPALGIWRQAGLPVIAIDPQLPLERQAGQLLARVTPQLLLVGLSGPDAGIDEHLLAEAGDIPRLAYQDFWGDVNASLGRPADCYLVLDEVAARITQQRFDLPTRVVGSLRQQQPAAVRRQPPGTRPLVAFCSQPLWDHAGYRRSIDRFFHSLPDCELWIRLHPKDDRRRRRQLLQMAHRAGLTPHWHRADLPDLLNRCDLLASVFSNCNYDLAQHNALPGSRGAVPLYLLFEPQMRALVRRWTGLRELPPTRQGLAISAHDAGQLRHLLHRPLRPLGRQLRQRSRRLLGRPGHAVGQTLDLLRQIAAKPQLVLQNDPAFHR